MSLLRLQLTQSLPFHYQFFPFAERTTQSPLADPEHSELILPKSEVDPTVHDRSSREFRRQRLQKAFNATRNLNSNAERDKPPRKKTSFRPASDYEYYDDADDSVIDKTNTKVMDETIFLGNREEINAILSH